ncbi:MAG: major capsid protein [Microviridae sp.]|nr:MAG: major capsid protein [Microviridae sp.]
MKRYKHSLSNYSLLTMDMGKLVPIGLQEVLPGDTFQQASSALIRFSPQLAPVMHPVTVRIHHWFVPHRLTMEANGKNWEPFITGGSDGLGEGQSLPTNAATFTPAVSGLADYLGLPATIVLPIGTVSMLPFYAYTLIFNEYYRDQDLGAARAITTASAANDVVENVSWEKDYFTAARPWTQKGPAVSLPIGTSATVKTSSTELITSGTNFDMKVRRTTGNAVPTADRALSTGGAGVFAESGNAATGVNGLYPSNLYADLSTATAATVNAVRQAFALQRYQEARAQYGSRYTEYLRYIGVRPSDARMSKPEYLGGGKQTVAFSEVLRTGNVTADATPNVIGQLKGHGIAALRSNRYRYFAEEHGYIMSLMSIRPKSIYVNGIERMWLKRTKEEFFQKELELIGQQAITNAEVFAGAVDATNKLVFGYQDRYSEYRHTASSVHGEFRTTLDFWHLGRKFGALPTLNQAFVDCVPGKRIFAEQTANSCWVMVNHNIQARRMVGKNTIGRAI